MRINRSEKFKREFVSIFEYIAKDKVASAIKFRKDLNESFKLLNDFPLKNRKSIYFSDENIRDMIFKHHTIIYEINTKDETIIILTIFNQNLPDIHSDYHLFSQKG